MGVAVHRGQLRPGRPGRHLRDGDRAVGPGEPLHVRERVGDAQRLQRRRAPPVDALVPRAGDVAGQHDRPLDPRVAQDLQRRRAVVGDRRPHGRPADGDAVEGVLLAGEELLEQRGGVLAQRHGAQPAPEHVAVVQPERGLGAGAVRRLGDQREADLLGERGGLPGAAHEGVPGAGDPGRLERLLHPRLVAHVERRPDVHALDAHGLAHLRQRHLQLLERADEPVHPAHLAGEPGHRPGRAGAGRARPPRASDRPAARAAPAGCVPRARR